MAKVCLFKNIPLNRNYTDVVNFRSMGNNVSKVTLSDMFKYYDPNKYSVNGSTISYIKCNFPLGDLLTTSIIIPISSENLDSNYLHVVFENNESLGDKKQAFYFINNISQYNIGTYRVDLELDVMTTYNDTLSFSTLVETERKHCFRFTPKDAQNQVELYSLDALLGDTLDGTCEASIVTSKQNIKLYEEDVLKPHFATDMSKVMWMYVYLKSETPLKILENRVTPTSSVYSEQDVGNTLLDDINLNYRVCVFPIGIECYINTYIPSPTSSWQMVKLDVDNFMKNIDTQASIIAIKFSNTSPFKVGDLNHFYDDTTRRLDVVEKFDINNYNDLDYCTWCYQSTSVGYGIRPLVVINNLHNKGFDIVLNDYVCGLDKINITEILTTTPKNIKLEPKMYTSPYFYQGIKNGYTNLFDFNLFAYRSPTTDNNYLACKKYGCTLANENNENYLYHGYGLSSLNDDVNIGVSYNNPCDMPWYVDAYRQAIATQRNSMMMGILTSGNKLPSSPTNIAVNALSTINTAINTWAKVQDLKNTPDTMASLGSSMLNIASYQGNLTPYYITMELTPSEKKLVFDYYYNNGYHINRLCELNLDRFFGDSDVINTECNKLLNRRLFNYIKLRDNSLVGKMNFNAPYVIKEKISDIFLAGFKMWVLATSDYNEAIVRHNKFKYFLSEEYENIEWFE